jgi:methionine-rich copper-binding protein CopC
VSGPSEWRGASLPRRVGLLAVVVLVALAGWVLAATPASAHNVLRSTSPADGSSVERVPAEVVLTFDEPALAMGTGLVVTGPAGPVQSGSARLVDNTVAQSIRPDAPAGTYTVQWRVTSADGHPVSGTFGFTASQLGGGTAAGSGSSPNGPSSALPSAGSETAPGRPPPGWLWPVVAVMLLASALVSALIARRRRDQ